MSAEAKVTTFLSTVLQNILYYIILYYIILYYIIYYNICISAVSPEAKVPPLSPTKLYIVQDYVLYYVVYISAVSLEAGVPPVPVLHIILCYIILDNVSHHIILC